MIIKCKYKQYKIFNKFWNSIKKYLIIKHEWEPLYAKTDEKGFCGSFPSREIRMKCKQCGLEHVEHKWAFTMGSGALEYVQCPGEKHITYVEHKDFDYR